MKLAFMCGMPRSGSSLLTSILNQRKDVYCSPSSYSIDIVRYLDLDIKNNENYLNGFETPVKNLLKDLNVIKSMYSYKNVDLVIDKSRGWGLPYYRRVLTENLSYSPKFLCPVRPLEDIVASFVHLAQKNPNNYIDRAMLDQDFLPFWRKNIDDARVDWILKNDGIISAAMLSLSGAFDKESSHMYHLIDYRDFVLSTENCLKKIEEFLELDRFDYDLNSISSEPNNNLQVYGIEDMHKVKSKIQPSIINSKKILSEYAIERCKLEDFWTKR